MASSGMACDFNRYESSVCGQCGVCTKLELRTMIKLILKGVKKVRDRIQRTGRACSHCYPQWIGGYQY